MSADARLLRRDVRKSRADGALSLGIELPRIDGRSRVGRSLLSAGHELERRLGPNPSIEARSAAGQILRAMHALALLDRKRAQTGALSDFDAEIQVRHENALARAWKRLERHTGAPKAKPSLAEHLARTYGPAAVAAK